MLNDLLERRRPLPELSKELSEFPWDSDESLVRLSKANVRSVLKYYLSGKASKEGIEGWASLMDCRDDIDYEDFADVIFRLASPEVHDKFDEAVVAKIIEEMGG